MPTNDTLAALWIDALLAEGLAVSSVDTYRDGIDCYLRFLSAESLSASTVTISDLRDYLCSLELAEATIAHRRAVLGSFHRFLAAEGLAASDPADLLEPMKRPQTIPTVVTVDEVTLLLKAAHSRARDASVGLYRQAGYARRAALLETLYASGMRISEAVHLRYRYITGQYATIVGKGQKDRLVLFNEAALTAIATWRELSSQFQPGPRDFVFHPTRNFRKPLTRNAAFKEIQDIAIFAGLRNPERLSPHILRHAFASHLLANGADLRVIQELLGHADIGTTEVYLHVLDRRRTNMVADLHPMNDAYREE